jgi:putative FmdB family regulatory protein
MPTYEYECAAQGHRFERFQRFSEAPVAECPECGAPVRRLIFPPPLIFKGPGFYKTDNAPKPKSSAEGEGKPSESGDGAAKADADAAKPAKPAGPEKAGPSKAKEGASASEA